MWKQFPGIAISSICALCFSVSHAQDSLSRPELKWDLATCLSYAARNNIQLRTLEQTRRSSEQNLLLSKAAKYPNLTGSMSQNIVNSKSTDPVVGGFQTQANFTSNYSLNSNFTLYNGGYLKNDVKQKELQLQVSDLDVQTALNDVTIQITQAYLNILLARENIVYLENLITTSQAQLKQGKQRYDAGAISKKDYIQFEGQVATDQYNLVTARNAYRQNIIALKQLLQLNSSVSFDVVVPDTLYMSPVITPLPDAAAKALAIRPEVQADSLSIRAAEFELEKSKAGRRPVITLNGALSTGYSDNRTDAYFPQLNNNFYQRAGLSMSIPIFNNRITKTNIEQSKIQIEQARLTLQGTKTTLDQAVEQAYISLLNARNQFNVAEVQLRVTKETLDITNEQLNLGAVNMVDLLTQKNLYVQALQNYIQAKYSAILNHKVYDFYTGIPVTL
ncbi:MAG: TolC family protein [Chitinophagaceae bacterium]|nr:TolC family protein [Chitinophagaceae bacterium]